MKPASAAAVIAAGVCCILKRTKRHREGSARSHVSCQSPSASSTQQSVIDPTESRFPGAASSESLKPPVSHNVASTFSLERVLLILVLLVALGLAGKQRAWDICVLLLAAALLVLTPVRTSCWFFRQPHIMVVIISRYRVAD